MPKVRDVWSGYQPAPGPLVITVTPPQRWPGVVRELRQLAGAHDDTGWIHPTPTAERDGLAALSQDLCDAVGAVGLTTPRAVGERHLIRGLTHLIHGPVRHLLLDDPTNLDLAAVLELHQACLVAGTQLWLLLDPTDTLRSAERTRELLDWTRAAGTPLTPDRAVRLWRTKPQRLPACDRPNPHWWTTYATGADLDAPCADHDTPTGESTGAVACLLSRMRRALTLGHLTPTLARAALNRHADHPRAVAADRWALTAAGRDLHGAGTDALSHVHPDATRAALRDVAVDGTTVHIGAHLAHVPAGRQDALARLRTSRVLSGCLPQEPAGGLFDTLPG